MLNREVGPCLDAVQFVRDGLRQGNEIGESGIDGPISFFQQSH